MTMLVYGCGLSRSGASAPTPQRCDRCLEVAMSAGAAAEHSGSVMARSGAPPDPEPIAASVPPSVVARAVAGGWHPISNIASVTPVALAVSISMRVLHYIA